MKQSFKGTRDTFYNTTHKKQIKFFDKLVGMIKKGDIKLIDVRVDESEWGHTRITIFAHKEEQ